MIEVVSPANKVGGSRREAYLDKQLEYRRGGVNLIEIDRIRTGRFVVAVPEHAVAPLHRTPYIIAFPMSLSDENGRSVLSQIELIRTTHESVGRNKSRRPKQVS